MSENKTGKMLLYIAGAIVVVAVVWGFSLVGSPSFNRKLSADRNRIEDLQGLQSSIEYYFEQQVKLPQSLQDLDKVRYWGRRSLEDPTTKTPYEYKAVDEFNYELCATFELTSKDAELERSRYRSYYGNDIDGKVWAHEVGHQCFKFEIPQGKRKGKNS